MKRTLLATLLTGALISAAYAQPVPGPTPGGGGGGGSGDVNGPGSSTDDNFPSFNGAGGKTLQDSGYSAASFAPAGVVSIVTSSQAPNAAAFAACKHYIANASSLTFTVDATSGLSANGCIEIETLANAATLTANAADTITYAGSTGSTGGSVTLGPNRLYRINTDGAGKLYVDGPPSPATHLVSGWWYWAIDGLVATGAAPGASTIFWEPIWFPAATTIKSVGFRVTTASAGGNIYVACADSTGTNGQPGTILASLTAAATNGISTAGTGFVNSSTNLTCAFPAGWNYIGTIHDNATSVVLGLNIASTHFGATWGSSTQSGLSGSATTGFTAYQTTSATPGVWSNNPTVTQLAATAAAIPAIQIQAN